MTELSVPLGNISIASKKFTNRVSISDFFVFHTSHPEIYRLFCQIAFEKRRKGYNKYSSKAIIEEIRWQSGTKVDISNSYTAFYARMFMAEYPSMKGLFKVNFSRADSVPDYQYEAWALSSK